MIRINSNSVLGYANADAAIISTNLETKEELQKYNAVIVFQISTINNEKINSLDDNIKLKLVEEFKKGYVEITKSNSSFYWATFKIEEENVSCLIVENKKDLMQNMLFGYNLYFRFIK